MNTPQSRIKRADAFPPKRREPFCLLSQTFPLTGESPLYADAKEGSLTLVSAETKASPLDERGSVFARRAKTIGFGYIRAARHTLV